MFHEDSVFVPNVGLRFAHLRNYKLRGPVPRVWNQNLQGPVMHQAFRYESHGVRYEGIARNLHGLLLLRESDFDQRLAHTESLVQGPIHHAVESGIVSQWAQVDWQEDLSSLGLCP